MLLPCEKSHTLKLEAMVRTTEVGTELGRGRNVAARTLALRPPVDAFIRPRPGQTTPTGTMQLGALNAAWMRACSVLAQHGAPRGATILVKGYCDRAETRHPLEPSVELTTAPCGL